MKITESQLKQIIREEVDAVLDENARKALAGLGLVAGLGASTPSYADYTDTSSQDQTTQQVDAETQEVKGMTANDDGSYTMTATPEDLFDRKGAKQMNMMAGNKTMLKMTLQNPAMAKMMNNFMDAGMNGQNFNYQVIDVQFGPDGKSITLKATPK